MMPTLLSQVDVEYPESDGQPMAENETHYLLLTTVKSNLEILFKDDPNVFVAGNLLWYPVEGNNTIRVASDVFTVFGRPKRLMVDGEEVLRGSYRQWEEGGIASQVVFEFRSPGNRAGELEEKLDFYERYDVEEYYLYDPVRNVLRGWLRQDGRLVEIDEIDGWRSPRLRIRFERTIKSLRICYPDGQPFLTDVEREEQLLWERQAKEIAQAQAKEAKALAERLAAQLRALGIDPPFG